MSKKDEVKAKPEPDNKKEDEIVTINDFKSMLVGMDLILGDEWTPDENQWKRIRAKIDALIVTHEQPRSVRSTVPSYGPDSNLNVSDSELLRRFPNVPVDSSVPIGEAAPAGQSALVPPQVAPTDNVKTPDIDSRAGYKSSFV